MLLASRVVVRTSHLISVSSVNMSKREITKFKSEERLIDSPGCPICLKYPLCHAEYIPASRGHVDK